MISNVCARNWMHRMTGSLFTFRTLRCHAIPIAAACAFGTGWLGSAPVAAAQSVLTSDSFSPTSFELAPPVPGTPPLSLSSPLTFSFTKGPGILALEAGTLAQQQVAANVVAGFNAAADLWRAAFVDPITIRLTIDYQALGAGILGSTSNATVGVTYGNTRLALLADQTSSVDATATANLPNVAARTFLTNNRGGTLLLDNDASANNTVLDMTRANAKALGLLAPADATSDGSVTFSSNFSFDFNRNDGISGSQFDFVGVAAHEIGHLMGFTSGVDTVDFYSGAGAGAATDLNGATAGIGTLDPFRVFTPLDLFRFSGQALAQGSGVLDLATGGTPFFSIDNGATNLGGFSTGVANGDGRQASHWKDSLGLGILDPTLSPGELAIISLLDLKGLDAIGYNPVPEPSVVIVCITLILVGVWRESRRPVRMRRRASVAA